MLKFENMKTLRVLLVGFGLIVALGCKNDEPNPEPQPEVTSRVTVQPFFGAQTLYLDSTYTTVEGYDVQFTDIKFYIGNPAFAGNVVKDAGLFDYRNRGTLLFEVNSDQSSFANLGGYLGIDSTVNHNDPAAFPNESMLNITNANDMHWGWNPGYIFVKVEAKVDTIADLNPLFDHFVTFHIGQDVNIQNLSFTGFNWTDLGNVYELPLKLDMATFLQNGGTTIDLKTEYTSHSMPGEEVLSNKVIVNFRDALSLF